MTAELFSRWMVWFASQVGPTAAKPVMLLVDGHSTRFQPELMQWCLDHHIHVLVSPANATAWCQVTDRTVFGELKVSIISFTDCKKA